VSQHSNRLERAANRRIVERKMGFHGYKATPHCDAVMNRAETLDGGIRLEEPIASTPVDRAQFFTNGFGANSTWTPGANDIANNFKMATWNWVKVFTPTVIDEIEAREAGGKTQVLNYLDNQLSLPSKDHKYKIARSLIRGDGTGLDFVGMLNAISEDGAATYGELTRRYFPALIGTTIDGSSVGSATVAVTADITCTESSNVGIAVGNDITSSLTDGREIVMVPASGSNEIRVIVHSELVGSDTHIYFNKVMDQSVVYTSSTVRDKLYNTGRYGAANKFLLTKLDRGWQATNGKVKHIITDSYGIGHVAEATRKHEFAISESERKAIGFSGFHNTLRYNGGYIFVDEHVPSGTFIGTDFDSWRFSWLQGFTEMRFRKNDNILNLFPNGALAVAATGYVLVNVAAFGNPRICDSFKLENVTG